MKESDVAKKNATKASAKSKISVADWRNEIRNTVAQTSPPLVNTILDIFDTFSSKLSGKISPRDFDKLSATFLNESEKCLRGVPEKKENFDLYPAFSVVKAQNEYLTARLRDLQAAGTRVALRASLNKNEKIEILRGMLTTRYLDARLKKFFLSGEIKTPQGAQFQGKGFRSTGQEAIYAAGIRLNRIGPDYAANRNGKLNREEYSGDFVAIMIRDLGLALAMGVHPFDVMAAQMGKASKPTYGKDLHFGDMSCGVLPPAAPIALSVGNAAGMGLALKETGRVIVNCNGDGGTSAGEWHEAINLAAVQKMPIVFVVQNNQTALSTPIYEQYACLNMASKAVGYGIRAITIDGTDPEAVFAAVTEAAESCRKGEGPVMVELVSMRMCGHAHHDDMLYFGHEPQQFLTYPEIKDTGYIDPEKYNFWRKKDPIATYRKKLMKEKIISPKDYQRLVSEVERETEAAAQKVVQAPWPEANTVSDPVFTDGETILHVEHLENRQFPFPEIPEWKSNEPTGFQPDPKGKTFWQAIAEALSEEMRRDPQTFILGQDVGGKYGNAFVILKPLLEEFGDRILNTPLSESAIIGAATGAALLGKRPIAEIQFNDFVASGFNQLVNNTAKIFARWKHPVPVTIRLPWGGLRNAGPYHSQNTEPWFYRTPGLKIVCPSTPREAKALLKAAIRDDNPVLYYEHIALYRSAEIKESLSSEKEDFVLPIGKAHLKKDGADLTLITYGAYVHRCLKASKQLEEDGISCLVLDLRSIQPLDKKAILWAATKTGKVMVIHEDSKTGGIGQSVASMIAEEAFEYLDAPVRVLGALDAPVPYSPPLEEAFLINSDHILKTARLLMDY